MKGWHIENYFQKERPSAKQNHKLHSKDVSRVYAENTRPVSINGSTKSNEAEIKKEDSGAKKKQESLKPRMHLQQAALYTNASIQNQFPLKHKKDVPLVEESMFSYKGQIFVSFLLLLLGLIALALFFVSLANSFGLSFLLFLGALVLIASASRTSRNYIEEINAKKNEYKKWPFKLIISIAQIIYSLIIAVIFGFIYAVIFIDPDLTKVALVSALGFIISMIIGFLFMPD